MSTVKGLSVAHMAKRSVVDDSNYRLQVASRLCLGFAYLQRMSLSSFQTPFKVCL